MKVLESKDENSGPRVGFPVDHISASSLTKFSSNPILFKINYMNREFFETAHSASSVIGKAFHKAMETYYGGTDDIVISSESEAIEMGLKIGLAFLEAYEDGFIKFNDKFPNKQSLFDRFTFAFTEYVKEYPYKPDQVLAVEDPILEHISIDWKGEVLTLPVKLKGYIDKVMDIDGKLVLEDYKTCASFSDPEKIDGAKMLQAVEYYLLAYVKYGRAPYSMIFTEVKHAENSAKSKAEYLKEHGREMRQTQQYEIVYTEHSLYFDFYFRFYEDFIRAMNGEQVYVPNVNTRYDNEVSIIAYIHRLDIPENTAKLMKKHQVDNLTDLLKKEMQSAGNMKKLMKAAEKALVSAKNIDYSKMKPEEKIRMKMMEHSMVLNFDSVVHGSSVDLYRYAPSIGLKMSRIRAFSDDVEQVLGVSGIRVLAPIPGSTLVGFEVPSAVRTFPTAPGNRGFDIAVGQTLTGETRYSDIRKAPHVLVVGASGSGKSVFLNVIIPQLKNCGELHLFDPKMVELSQFSGIAVEYEHDAEQINVALHRLVLEMEERYKKLNELGKRDVEGSGIPYKFVVIDEFGDLAVQNPEGYEKWNFCETHEKWNARNGGMLEQLMHKAKPRVRDQEIIDSVIYCENCTKIVVPPFEKSLLRLAQKGRAAGIHLVIATQRPSADVIKGTIKANFPTKVVFKTAKAVDSLVALDEPGAEKLLGKGDMLFAGDNGIERLQGFNA